MQIIYPIIISFLLVFISELGDKTQLLVLSFSSKVKSLNILIGVAIGSFFSHGIAILFGSSIGILENNTFHYILEIVTYSSFILFGIISFIPSKKSSNNNASENKLIKKLINLGIGYVFIIAFSIAIGELGDKTFLASIGLGISYPYSKFFLILGSILGMIAADSIAIVFGKFLKNKISEETMQKLSGFLFIIFGIINFIKLFNT